MLSRKRANAEGTISNGTRDIARNTSARGTTEEKVFFKYRIKSLNMNQYSQAKMLTHEIAHLEWTLQQITSSEKYRKKQKINSFKDATANKKHLKLPQ